MGSLGPGSPTDPQRLTRKQNTWKSPGTDGMSALSRHAEAPGSRSDEDVSRCINVSAG